MKEGCLSGSLSDAALGGDAAQRLWLQLRGKGRVGGGIAATRENPECFQLSEGPGSFSPELKNKQTNKIATHLCSFVDHGSYFGNKKGNPQMCSDFKMLNSFQTCDISFILFSPVLDFRQNVLQNVLEPDYNLI